MKYFKISKSRKHKNRTCIIASDESDFKELETLIGCYPYECSPIKYDHLHIMSHEIDGLISYLNNKGWVKNE